MKRKIISCILLLCVCASSLIASAQLSEDAALNAQVVRLHVIAASDSQEDQRVKLLVRDAILEVLQPMKASNSEEAIRELRMKLDDLAACARQVLAREGMEKSIEVRLCTEEYPVRDYGTFALPAGEYVSLQVRLGEAEGQNWWCVVYPGLCHATDDEAFLQVAEAAGLSDGQIRLMTVDSTQVQFRFKLLELLQKIKNFF